MSSKNHSNTRKYIISWDDGDYSDIMNSLEECEHIITETIKEGDRNAEDALVYELSAAYTVKSKGVQLTKRNQIN